MLAVVAADIHLMPDWTVSVQTGIFLCAAAVLYVFVFRPCLRIIDRRAALTRGTHDEAERLNAEAAALEDERHGNLSAALTDAHAISEKKLAASRREADNVVADARAEARRLLDSTEMSVERWEEGSQEKIEQEARGIAKSIVAKLMDGAGK